MQKDKAKFQIVYKVVTRNLKSSHFPTNFPCSIQYSTNQYVKAKIKNSFIFAFNSLEDAKSFSLRNISPLLIYKSYAYVKKIYLPGRLPYLRQPNNYSAFWKSYSNKEEFIKFKNSLKKWETLVPPPKGTVFCTSLKLIKQVPYIWES